MGQRVDICDVRRFGEGFGNRIIFYYSTPTPACTVFVIAFFAIAFPGWVLDACYACLWDASMLVILCRGVSIDRANIFYSLQASLQYPLYELQQNDNRHDKDRSPSRQTRKIAMDVMPPVDGRCQRRHPDTIEGLFTKR